MQTSPRLDRSATVAAIVRDHSETAHVFQGHRIDFCCHGDVTVEEACAGRGLDPAAVYAELEDALRARAGDPRDGEVAALSTPELIERIVERHHGYLRRVLPALRPIAAKVASVHGEHNPKLVPLEEAVEDLALALEPHLEMEETVLFPALVRGESPAVTTMLLDEMLDDHLSVAAQLERVRELTDDFTVPAWGCTTYRAYVSELLALAGDIYRHVHLENHVLLPRFQRRA